MLSVFYILVVGHLIADFVLQRELAVKKKGFNNEMLLHTATAAFLFIVPLVLFSYPVNKVAVASCVLFVVHTIIDVLKIKVNERLKIKPDSYLFWSSIGIDQIAHITTIYIIFTQLVAAS